MHYSKHTNGNRWAIYLCAFLIWANKLFTSRLRRWDAETNMSWISSHLAIRRPPFIGNSKCMEISLWSDAKSDKVIATKLCTCHDSWAVVTCAKFGSNRICRGVITTKQILVRIEFRWNDRLWNGTLLSDIAKCWSQVTFASKLRERYYDKTTRQSVNRVPDTL